MSMTTAPTSEITAAFAARALADRKRRAEEQFSDYSYRKAPGQPGFIVVTRKDDPSRSYITDGKTHCGCADFEKRGGPCKHMLACELGRRRARIARRLRALEEETPAATWGPAD